MRTARHQERTVRTRADSHKVRKNQANPEDITGSSRRGDWDGVLAKADFNPAEILAVNQWSAIELECVKPLRLSDHALRYASKRGFTLNEVEDAIRTTPWRPAELGRLECRKDFDYGKEWNRKVYATKQVRPVFVEEASELVVVTVYTYYF